MAKSDRVVFKDLIYERTTLPNGIRVVTERLPWVRSVSIGIWLDVGSRHEQPDENGISHFIEHMVFKGTKRRTAKQVGASLESIGGTLNAFTSRERTCFAARVPDEYLAEAVDVLADMTCCATFTKGNIEREKTVVLEEIKELDDTPADRIHDNFSETFWGMHALGRPIMGRPETVGAFTRAQLRRYWREHYRSGSTVISAAGAVSHRKLVRLIREKLDLPPGCAVPAEPAERTRGSRVQVTTSKGLQTHLCLGFPGLSFNDPQRTAASVLSAYLGGGMSSVLFQKIREDRGLVYSVDTYQDFYKDAGVFGAYLGTDDKKVREAFDLIMQELRRVKRNRLPQAKLDKIKRQIKGHLSLALESTTTRMTRMGRQELVTGDYLDIGTIRRRYDRVTAADVRDVANRILDESAMAVSVLGPVPSTLFDDVAS